MKLKMFGVWLLSALGLVGAPLAIGAKIPDLEVTTHDGKTVKLAPAEGDDYLFVFFYPKAMTGGCTKQVCSVQAAFEKLINHKVTIFGVSSDKVAKQKEFAEKENLKYQLVADPEAKVMKAYGVPLMLGKLASRQAYLFKNGKLIWRDLEGMTDSQGDEVLAAIAASEK